MASIVPMNAGGIDIGRPGQQLLPGYVVKLLKTLKIPFGTERGMTGIDVDPTINLIGHIFECIGALREINKVYRAKGSLASRSIGTRVLFGLTSELGNIILDAITFDPPPELREATIYYNQISSSILTVFPEVASQMNPMTGKVLLHQAALKTSAAMAIESLKLVVKAYPAAAWTPDRAGALPLHWITQNGSCGSEMIGLLIASNPKGPWVADSDGYLPLHWAVNQDFPNIDVVSALISANGSAAAKPCNKGSLPLHWSVNRERPTIAVVKALAQVHPDGVRTFDKNGWLPLHQCVNRSEISAEAVLTLIELYPQALQCPNSNGQLPLHRALDQTNPSFEAVKLILDAFPGAAKVADDEGYLPIHLALDCSRPDPNIASLLLQYFPESAFHKSKDGLLPLHCIISSMNPVIDIVQQLLEIFPDSSEIMAVDLMPTDDTADPQIWQGEWTEKRWTPLSRAIDRGLDAIVVLFRMALNSNNQQRSMMMERTASSSNPMMNNASAARVLPPQSKPPLNNLAALQAVNQIQSFAVQPASPNPDGYTSGSYAGPSTSSVDQYQQAANNRSRLVLGGNLDNEEDLVRLDNLRTPLHAVGSDAELMQQSSHVMRSRPGGVPPPLKDRAPGGSVVGRTSSSHRNRSREKDRGERDREHERDDRDRRRRRERDQSESRERDNRDNRHSSSRHHHRTSTEEKRSSSRRGGERERDRDRDRDREHKHRESDADDYDEDRRPRSSSRPKSSSQHKSRGHVREPSDQPPYRSANPSRLYERDDEEEEEDVYRVNEGMENLNVSMKNTSQRHVQQDSPFVTADLRDLTNNSYVNTPLVSDHQNNNNNNNNSNNVNSSNNNNVPSSSTKIVNRPQSATVPTNSLLDAANASARATPMRKGQSAGKTRQGHEFRSDLQHSRDAMPDEFQPVAVSIRQMNHSSSIDDLV